MDFDLTAKNSQELLGKLKTYFKSLHDGNNHTSAEIKRIAEKASADIDAMEQRLAELSARQSAPVTHDSGPASELRNFIRRGATSNGSSVDEGVQLFRSNVRYRGVDIGRANGLLDCDETFGSAHARAKDAYAAMMMVVSTKRGVSQPQANPQTWAQVAPKSFAKLCHALESMPGQTGKILRGQVDQIYRGAMGDMSIAHKIFTNLNGTGGEFIPGEVRLPELERDLRLANIDLAINNIETRPTSTVNLKIPFAGTGLIPYLYGYTQGTNPPAFTATTPDTAKRSVDIKGMAVRLEMDRDADEDSVVDARAAMSQMIARALLLGQEDAFINGDTAASHQDAIASWSPNNLWGSSFSGGGGKDHRRAYLGLRARAFDIGSSVQVDASAALTYGDCMALAGAFTAPYASEGQMILTTSYQAYFAHFLAIEELVTLEKYGQGAAVLSGEIGRIGPWVLMKTPVLASDMASTGLYTGSGALATAVGYNRDRYCFYERQGVVVELDIEIRNGTVNMVARLRRGLHAKDHGASLDLNSIRNVGIIRNI
ncbi:MAG: hypothetical protein AAFV53_28870 [Myxococcota bacterium]